MTLGCKVMPEKYLSTQKAEALKDLSISQLLGWKGSNSDGAFSSHSFVCFLDAGQSAKLVSSGYLMTISHTGAGVKAEISFLRDWNLTNELFMLGHFFDAKVGRSFALILQPHRWGCKALPRLAGVKKHTIFIIGSDVFEMFRKHSDPW